ncbi:myb-binding protein 1A-like protein [Diorhabda carinulata]|uniref:myb-binding protein 1A-like protein n=1 Tax=Diorhabda carinulata TaxID=1163345 RepID=UPI0025A0460E|nr:myb-binding protein 1A-like protein [Diorhabda carinulata]
MEKMNGEEKVKNLKRNALDQFELITSPQEKIRLKGSFNIVKHLSDTGEKEGELNHALSRIVRGLGSSSSNSRAGFYTILVAVLNLKPNISVDQIFELIHKHLHTSGSNSKSENADILTGQILACGAIIRSNLWFKADKERIRIIKCILNACKERDYQGLLGFEFLINAFNKVDEQEFYHLCPLLKDEISKPVEEHNLDSLYLIFNIQTKYPNLPKKLKFDIKYPSFFSEENVPKLCKILMIIQKLTALQHPVYDVISTKLVTSDILPRYLEEIDRYLEIPSRNKFLVAVKMFTIFLEKLEDVCLIPLILTKNFIHQVLNHFKSLKGKDQDVDFKSRITKFFGTLSEKIKMETVTSTIKIVILKKLLFSPGTFIFEKITHSKIIQSITWSLDTEGVKKLGEVYKGVIDGSEIVDSQYGHGDYWLNNDKLYAAHLLIKLLNHKNMKEENEWKIQQLIFIMELGLLKENNIQIGTELSASLKAAFFGALDLKLSKLEELHNILSHIVLHLNSKLSPENLESILRTPITSEEFAIWEKTVAIIKKIEKKRKKRGLKSVFLTLFLHLALLLFNDPKLASDALNELFVCYEKTRKNRNDSVLSEDQSTEVDDNEEMMWIEVVTDLFLNFLSQNSHLLRNIINLVFPYLCEYMTPSTIQQLVSVLDPENENPLSKGNAVSDEEDSDSSDEESEKEDDEDDDDSEDDIEDQSTHDKLRMALHQVLNSNGYKSDEESIDIDEMSETEGEKLDKALAGAFKQFRPNHGKSNKQNEEQRSLTHFRIRVLDLIDKYLDSTPSMMLSLEIMLPLLKTVEFCVRDEHQSPLLNRLKTSIKKLSSLKKFSDTDLVNETVLGDLLKSLLEKGTKNTWIVQDMREQISDCCIFVIKCSDLLANSESTPKKVRKRLKNSINELISNEFDTYFNKRECITPYLVFKNLVKISWSGNITLMPLILKYIFDENVKMFKKVQATELALLFYTNQRYLSVDTESIRESLNESHAAFSNNVISLFKSFCDKKPSEKFICSMFKLLSVLKTCVLNIENIDWERIAETIREYRSTVSLAKDAKTAFNKLCDRLKISNIVKMKPTVSSVRQSVEEKPKDVKEKKKNKQKMNKEKLKLKKDAKALRLESLSEGFKNLDFASANEENMVTGDNDDESSEERTQESVVVVDKKSKKKRKCSENLLENGVGENFNSKGKKHKTN